MFTKRLTDLWAAESAGLPRGLRAFLVFAMLGFGSSCELHHYTLPGASAGDITSFGHEVVVDHLSGEETVNIRAGAAIGVNDQMVIAFGLGTDVDGHTEQVLTKTAGRAGWTQEAAGTQLGHDFYYPFVALWTCTPHRGDPGTVADLP